VVSRGLILKKPSSTAQKRNQKKRTYGSGEKAKPSHFPNPGESRTCNWTMQGL